MTPHVSNSYEYKFTHAFAGLWTVKLHSFIRNKQLCNVLLACEVTE